METPASPPRPLASERCERCLKPASLCVCSGIPATGLETKPRIVILQHPQEPDKDLGTARLAHLALPGSLLKIGLSWPNLRAVVGEEVQPSRWAALYLGSGIQGNGVDARPGLSQLVLVDKKGAPLPERATILPTLQGIVVLDGTWSQAKALWWRNPWLLKLRRAILIPGRPSLYGPLRKEPRRECVSTIESVAFALEALGEPATIPEELVRLFGKLLDQYRASDRRLSSGPRRRRPGRRKRR